MELENNTNYREKSFVSSNLREFFQRMLIEQIDSLNAKDQIFSSDMSLIDQLITELSKPPVILRRRKMKYDENVERNIAVRYIN
jgi:hypothetical protein